MPQRITWTSDQADFFEALIEDTRTVETFTFHNDKGARVKFYIQVPGVERPIPLALSDLVIARIINSGAYDLKIEHRSADLIRATFEVKQ